MDNEGFKPSVVTKKVKKRHRYSKSFLKEEKMAYLFIIIPLLGFLIFTFSSTIYSFYLSLTNYNPIRSNRTRFVGFDNYVNLFQNEEFGHAILNTITLLLSVPVGMFAGLLLAIYLKHLAKGSKLVSLIFYLPVVTSAVAICSIWQYMFNHEYGLINKIFGLGIDWFDNNDFWIVKIAIFIKGVWGSLGSTMILYYAGLNNIPESYFEAAQMDGASKLQEIVHITIPMCNPTTFYLIVTTLIGHLQAYADAKIFAKGAKQAQTIIYFIWTYGIDDHKYGYASAAAIMLAVTIALITIVQFKHNKLFKLE